MVRGETLERDTSSQWLILFRTRGLMIHEPESRLCYASISDVAIKSGALRRTLITIFPAYLRHFAHRTVFLVCIFTPR